MGQTDVGRVVGLGCTADLGTDPALLYVGFIALQSAIDDPRRADKAGAILALVGVVNVPIIYFSVKWWNTLHQGSSVNLAKSSMATIMLWGMLLCALACWMYAIAVALMRVRLIILERERHTDWVREVLANRRPEGSRRVLGQFFRVSGDGQPRRVRVGLGGDDGDSHGAGTSPAD